VKRGRGRGGKEREREGEGPGPQIFWRRTAPDTTERATFVAISRSKEMHVERSSGFICYKFATDRLQRR